MTIFITGKTYNTAIQSIEEIATQVNADLKAKAYYDSATFEIEEINENGATLIFHRELNDRVNRIDMIRFLDANMLCGITDEFKLPQMWGEVWDSNNVYMQCSNLAKFYKYNSRILCPENRVESVEVTADSAQVRVQIKY